MRTKALKKASALPYGTVLYRITYVATLARQTPASHSPRVRFQQKTRISKVRAPHTIELTERKIIILKRIEMPPSLNRHVFIVARLAVVGSVSTRLHSTYVILTPRICASRASLSARVRGSVGCGQQQLRPAAVRRFVSSTRARMGGNNLQGFVSEDAAAKYIYQVHGWVGLEPDHLRTSSCALTPRSCSDLFQRPAPVFQDMAFTSTTLPLGGFGALSAAGNARSLHYSATSP